MARVMDGETGQIPHELIARALQDDTPCLVVVVGPALGRVFDLSGGDVSIGRDPDSRLLLDAEGVSRRHAVLEPEGRVFRIRDLGSTNGTFVNGARSDARTIAHGDILTFGTVSLRFVEAGSVERSYYRSAWEASVRDPLTGVFNRRHFDETLTLELARARRHSRELSLLMLDIDRFKAVNDSLGHPCGDAVLRELPRVISASLRATDLVARYGGEEFAVVLPETDLEGARRAAERMRRDVERHSFPVGAHVIRVTVSVGAATVTFATGTPQTLVAAADARLYEAKRAGRNRVVA
jgi:diguanylate cyclase (GGDEF)-like protein